MLDFFDVCKYNSFKAPSNTPDLVGFSQGYQPYPKVLEIVALQYLAHVSLS